MKIKLIILSLIVASFSFAHVGGHHHENKNLKVWHFDNGTTLEGSFSLFKNGKVYIETANHSVVAYEVEKLSSQDKEFVSSKVEEINRLNSNVVASHDHKVIESEQSGITIPTWAFGLLIIVIALQGFILFKKNKKRSVTISVLFISLVGLTTIIASCKKEGCTDSLAENYDTSAKKDDGSCTYEDASTTTTSTSTGTYSSSPNANTVSDMEAAFAPYAPHVSYSNDGTTFFVEADAIADHEMMKGITAWIDQFPIYQKMTGSNSWQIPIQPSYSTDGYNIEDHFRKYAIGVAANGIAIFNPWNASDMISADIGELDEYGGHAGTGDDYHYHLAPTHLEVSNTPTIIAYALDGFPVYGNLEPDGSAMQDLDDFYHGHEIDGSFHYHGSATYPYMVNTFRGTVGVENANEAPSDQITPQPSTQNFRGNPYGLTGAASSTLIDSCVANGLGNGYTLYYTIDGNVKKKVEYDWVAGATDTITLNFYHDTGSNLDQTQVWTR